MVSKFIFLVMRDFFLENNAFEQIIVNDEITAPCQSNMFPSVLNVTNNKNKLLKTVRLIIVLKPTISNRFKFYFLQSSLSIRA